MICTTDRSGSVDADTFPPHSQPFQKSPHPTIHPGPLPFTFGPNNLGSHLNPPILLCGKSLSRRHQNRPESRHRAQPVVIWIPRIDPLPRSCAAYSRSPPVSCKLHSFLRRQRRPQFQALRPRQGALRTVHVERQEIARPTFNSRRHVHHIQRTQPWPALAEMPH
jgi:hypothetical protein